MKNFDPHRLEFKYDVQSEVPGILTAASTTETFIFLFMGTLSTGFAHDKVICLLLQHVEGFASTFRRCGIVTKAGDDETWKAVVPKSSVVIV